MKINRKLLVGLGVTAAAVLLISELGFTEGLEEELLKYLESDKLDLLGREFEKILFKHTKGAANPPFWDDVELKAKLQFVVEDIKTLPLQAKCYWRIVNQKPNALIYGLLGGNSYQKMMMGEKAYKGMVFKLFKLLVRRLYRT